MDSAAAPERIDAVAHALADGTRRGLLRLVFTNEQAAGDLAAAFPRISRPAVSQHLRVLHQAGLVSVRPDGNRRLYRARREGLAEVWQFIDEMWTDRLAKLKEVAEQAESSKQASVTSRPKPDRNGAHHDRDRQPDAHDRAGLGQAPRRPG